MKIASILNENNEKYFVASMFDGTEVNERLGSYDNIKKAFSVAKNKIKKDFGDDEHFMDNVDFTMRGPDWVTKKGNKVWEFGVDEMSIMIMTNEYPAANNLR